MSKNEWVGVDLDGTLAEYHGWKGIHHIGDPIMPMVNRVKEWIANGMTIKIFTARVAEGNDRTPSEVRDIIQDWCEKHIGERLEVTNVKDFGMIELWDDRAVRVVANKGVRCCGN